MHVLGDHRRGEYDGVSKADFIIRDELIPILSLFRTHSSIFPFFSGEKRSENPTHLLLLPSKPKSPTPLNIPSIARCE